MQKSRTPMSRYGFAAAGSPAPLTGADFQDVAGVTAHPHAMDAVRARKLRAHRRHARLCVLDAANFGEQQVLDARSKRADGDKRARLLLDLDHPREVGEQSDGPAEILQ